jgi:hypothetical protein
MLYVGVILGVVTYISWMGYYVLYLPKRIRYWFEQSMGRLFILDIALTVLGMLGFSGVSDSLTAVIAASTLGLLGTVTTISIRSFHLIKTLLKIQ